MKSFFSSQKTRLSLIYLSIIMTMSILFSGVIYNMSRMQLERPMPLRPQTNIDNNRENFYRQLLDDRASAAKTELLLWLWLLNVLMFVFGAWFSIFLARKTLGPIERSMQRQSQFVSDASHELRTPITALQTTNEVALRSKKLTLKEARKQINYNIDEAQKLRDLTDALLSLVKNENDKAILASYSIVDMFDEVLQQIVALAQVKKISINDNIKPANVLVNRQTFEQVLRIILDNAIKYSPNGSTVEIVSSVSQNKLILSITDSGRGIEEKDQKKIFERFYRVESSRTKSTQEPSGFGLGLAIAKSICDSQNIQIKVSSEIGKGATFTLIIPISIS